MVIPRVRHQTNSHLLFPSSTIFFLLIASNSFLLRHSFTNPIHLLKIPFSTSLSPPTVKSIGTSLFLHASFAQGRAILPPPDPWLCRLLHAPSSPVRADKSNGMTRFTSLDLLSRISIDTITLSLCHPPVREQARGQPSSVSLRYFDFDILYIRLEERLAALRALVH